MVDQVVITEAPTTAVVETTDVFVIAPKTDIQVVTTTQDKVAVVQTDSIDVATVEKDSTIVVESKDIVIVNNTVGQQGPPGIGVTGAAGAQGVPGVPIFLVAEEGEQGDMGPQGVKGDMGPQGVKGATGTTGVAGTNGVDGAQGVPGVPIFLVAEEGEQGDMGPQGVKGDTGATGAAGTNGVSGIDGAQGVPGVPLFLTAEDGEEGPMGPPGTGSGSSGVGTYFDPVTWDGVNDRVLGVGQHTSDSFTAQTSMPLHIACGDGQIYEIEIVGSFAAAAAGAQTLIQPNNAVPTTNSFDISHIKVSGTTVSGNTLTASADGGFVIGYSSSVLNCKCCVFTSTLTKAVETLNSKCWDTTNGRRLFILNSEWLDTTTLWSSLGTITMPNAWTGTITVRRVA